MKFAPGATTYTTVLPSVSVGAFALDSQDNIYAEVPTSPTTFQIEEFLAGSTTPTRIIGGSNTTLVDSGRHRGSAVVVTQRPEESLLP